MKILHLIDSGGLYGAEKMLLTLAREQEMLGLKPTILSAGAVGEAEKAIEREARNIGIDVVDWRMKRGLNIIDTLKILFWARGEGYRILHSHGYKFTIMCNLLRPFRRLPLVTTIHGKTRTKRFSKLAVYQWLENKALKLADRVVGVCDTGLVKYNLSKGAPRVVVVENGIHFGGLNLIGTGNKPETKTKKVISAGRLSYEKGFDLLIKGCSQFAERTDLDIELTIYGDGPLMGELIAEADRTGGRLSVHFPGYTSKLFEKISENDLYVISSRTEAMPLTVLEAAYAGVPILATDVGEIRNMLATYPAAIMVTPDSPEAIAWGLEEAIKLRPVADRSLLTPLIERFSARRMAEEYSRVYEAVLDGR